MIGNLWEGALMFWLKALKALKYRFFGLSIK